MLYPLLSLGSGTLFSQHVSRASVSGRVLVCSPNKLHSTCFVLKLNRRCCSATADAPPAPPDEQHRQSEARVRRLKVLVQLRRLYRNLIRGQCLLDHPSPVYCQTGGPPLGGYWFPCEQSLEGGCGA